MIKRANYTIVHDDSERMVILDVGPWDLFPTVTNDIEGVVNELVGRLNGKRLFYYDSENNYDEIVIENETFVGFRPGIT